jgi:PAS domain S-box-containing protein
MEQDRLLQTSELRYRRLFETARDGILILNADTGKIEHANPFMSELLGYAQHELIGKELWEIGLFRDIEDSRTAFLQLQNEGAIRYEDLPLQTKDGALREVEFVSNIYKEDGHSVIQCNIRDISVRKRLERRLEEQTEKLIDADRLKSDFLAILSHELRNPLAPIRYALPQLEQAPLDESARKALAVVTRQVNQLVRLVDDLLDLTRVTSGKVVLRPAPVMLETVVNAAVESASPVILAAHHRFEAILPAEPVWIDADLERLSQVLSNLLTNAARYTPRGGNITLEAGRNQDQAVIRVSDDGTGIPEDELPRLFEMFRQLDHNKSSGGLGVGLTLAKSLVEMHGGSIEAHSAGLGRGAEFIVRLPLATEPTAAQATDAPPPLAGGRRLKVLVVDDNSDLVDMLQSAVEGMGHEVRKALDGRSAIAAALSYRPDVILLDLGLPDIGGMDVARDLRRAPEMAKVKLVALTGWGQEANRQDTSDAGFDCHVTKPSDLEVLKQLLATFAMDKA